MFLCIVIVQGEEKDCRETAPASHRQDMLTRIMFSYRDSFSTHVVGSGSCAGVAGVTGAANLFCKQLVMKKLHEDESLRV